MFKQIFAKSLKTAIIAATVVCSAETSAAGYEDVGISDLHEVPNGQLAEMRGRFISGSTLAYFGVEMYTHWITGDGDTLSASLGMRVNLNSRTEVRPTVTLASNVKSSETLHADVQGGSLGGITDINGAAQSIQVSGDRNVIQNTVRMNVCTGRCPEPSRGTHGSSVTLNRFTNTTFTSPGGATTTFTVDPSKLSLAIRVPGHGAVIQQLRGSGAEGRGILQGAQISGHDNRIHSVLMLNIGTKALAFRNAALPSFTTSRGLPDLARF